MDSLDLAKAIGTIAAAVVCGTMIWITSGESGAGWFIIALLVIWGAG